MTISPAASGAEWEPVSQADRQMAVLKKSRDVQQAQAEALIELVNHVAPMPEHVGTRLNVLA